MMKKALIITLVGNSNFGNKLQNYALQEYLKENNYSVDTLWPKESVFQLIKSTMKKILIYIFGLFSHKLKIEKNVYKKEKYIKKFTDKYLNINKIKLTNKNLSDLDNVYDKYVIGSDQIWNPNVKGYEKISYANFSKKPNSKISYAASIGVEIIPENYKQELKMYINNVDYISVREESAKQILSEYVNGKDIEVSIDPTMLIDTKEWEKIIKKPKSIKNNKFILMYFLGDIPKNVKKQIKNFADENNCEIIDILDKNSKFYINGPEEFLYLEKNAFLICTDSFHSCVFAILFNRPFIVFERKNNNNENMNTRLENLIKKFELERMKYNGTIEYESLIYDYNKCIDIINKERNKSKNYMDEALNYEISNKRSI